MGKDTGSGGSGGDSGPGGLSVQLEGVGRGDGVCLPLNPAVVLLLADTGIWANKTSNPSKDLAELTIGHGLKYLVTKVVALDISRGSSEVLDTISRSS